ncbi:MAG: hypothetical protein WCO44_01015 [Bacteroidota bacterium]
MKEIRPSGNFILTIFKRTFLRFNPFAKPVIPALSTIYLLAVVFTALYLRDLILCTFIVEYREIAVSAWGFLLLINFLEAVTEAFNDHDHDGTEPGEKSDQWDNLP